MMTNESESSTFVNCNNNNDNDNNAEETETRSSMMRSSEAMNRRKVSFEDEDVLDYGFTSILMSSLLSSSILKEEKRVVSNETIHGIHIHTPVESDSHSDLNNTTKSKSLPSLTRSGDLKTLLLEETSTRVTHTRSSVSEDCLLSSSSIQDGDDEEMMIHESLNIHHQYDDDVTSSSTSLSSLSGPTESMLAHTSPSSCTGWGQFIDFIPSEHHVVMTTALPRTEGNYNNHHNNKERSPIRRRRSTFLSSSSSRYRRYKLGLQYSTELRNCRRPRSSTTATTTHKQQQSSSSLSSIMMYKNQAKDYDFANAFQIQLSLRK